jgi:surfactin synthase thioesterase subunit
MTTSPWFQRLSPNPAASLRLFCFHHAGGSAALFRLWPRKLPEFDLCAVQLPGRANRLVEPAYEEVPALIDALVPEILPLLDRPFALFGHSMGSAIACALARRLHAIAAPMPAHLFVSGRQPPHRPFPEFSLRGLSDAEVVEQINTRYGGFPPEADAELIALLLPALRADFAALEAYMPSPEPQLPIPVTAIGGSGDPCAARDHLEPWQAYTARPLRIRHFPGDHFYLDDRLDQIAATLRAALAGELSPQPGQRAA